MEKSELKNEFSNLLELGFKGNKELKDKAIDLIAKCNEWKNYTSADADEYESADDCGADGKFGQFLIEWFDCGDEYYYDLGWRLYGNVEINIHYHPTQYFSELYWYWLKINK